MRSTLHFFICLLLLAIFNQNSHAQGIIINEGGNGQGANRDYFELLVIGSATQLTGTVDLTGWILDDNNGDFGGGGANKGIAQGHMRFRGSCFTNVPIGSIIVVYNAADREPLIPADDPTDSNGDLVYIIPSNHSCFEYCSARPSTSTTLYTGCASYVTPFPANQWSGVMAFASATDAFQIRKPNGTFFHGYGYGFTTAQSSIVPTLPTELGGGNSFNLSGASGNTTINYYCGALNNVNSYERVAATTATPGAANNTNNANLIGNIRQGTFNYNNWSDPDNCVLQIINLPLDLVGFEAKANSQLLVNDLSWELVKVDPYSKAIIQRSKDAVLFEDVKDFSLEATMDYRQYIYQDHTPFYTTYYRLKFIEPNAPVSYSAVKVAIHKGSNNIQAMAIYPNPTNTILNVLLENATTHKMNYQIVDILGRGILQGVFEAGNINYTLMVDELPSGIYFLRLESGLDVYTVQKFTKN